MIRLKNNTVVIDTICVNGLIKPINDNFFYFDVSFNEQFLKMYSGKTKSSGLPGSKSFPPGKPTTGPRLFPMRESSGPSKPMVGQGNVKFVPYDYKIVRVRGVLSLLHGKLDAVVISTQLIRILDQTVVMDIFNWGKIKNDVGKIVKNVFESFGDYKYLYTPSNGNLKFSIIFVISLMLYAFEDRYTDVAVDVIKSNNSLSVFDLFDMICNEILKVGRGLSSKGILVNESKSSPEPIEKPGSVRENVGETREAEETNNSNTVSNDNDNTSEHNSSNLLHDSSGEREVNKKPPWIRLRGREKFNTDNR